MNRYSLTHLSDQELLRGLAALAAQDRANNAAMLAHIAEADARQLDHPLAGDELLEAAHRYRSETEQPDAECSLRPEPQTELSPGTVEAPAPEVTQLAPQLYLLDVTLDRETYDNLLYAQALLGDEIPPGDVAEVIRRALETFIQAHEE